MTSFTFVSPLLLFLLQVTGWGKTAVAFFSAILSIMTTDDSDNRISSGLGGPNLESNCTQVYPNPNPNCTKSRTAHSSEALFTD